jgi:benzodiazapine receptor
MNNAVKLVLSLAITVITGLSGGFFSVGDIPGWYAKLNKPAWNPPNWIFPPVWTTLYVMMGISLFLVWKSNVPRRVKKAAIVLFSVQLILNFFWSFIFFKEHAMGWALAEIITLWLMILITIFAFGKISSLAAWLLVPYISWVSFAIILNYTFWKMN